MSIKNKIFHRTTFKRTIFFLFCDVVLIALSCYLGFLLRFDGNINSQYFLMIRAFAILAIPLTIIFFAIERLYSISWSFISIREIMKLGRAIVLSFASLGAILFVLKDHTLFQGFPRSIIFVSGAMALFLTGTLRFAKRIYIHGFKNKSKDKRKNKN